MSKSAIKITQILCFLSIASAISNPAGAQSAVGPKAFTEARKDYADSIAKMRKSEEEWRALGEKLRTLATCKLNPTREVDTAISIRLTTQFEAVAKLIRAQLEEFEKKNSAFAGACLAEVDICKKGPEVLQKDFTAYQEAGQTTYHHIFEEPSTKPAALKLEFLQAVANSRASIDKSIAQFSKLSPAEQLLAGPTCMVGTSPAKVFEKSKAKLREVEANFIGAEKAPGVQQRLHDLVLSSAAESGTFTALGQKCGEVGMATAP